MPSYNNDLAKIDDEKSNMLQLLREWAHINSGSDNLPGLSKMLDQLSSHFAKLGGKIQKIDLQPRHAIDDHGASIEIPHGKALSIIKRPEAKIKVFLGGHMDTVYPATHPFQETSLLNPNTLVGPGVADMKGGLVVMLKALETFENHPLAENIGWEVLINPDEEVGSIGSKPLLIKSAQRNTLGLVFEPSLPDGSIVSSRKGSANLAIISRGKAAHAGRDFHHGRNAIIALSTFMVAAKDLTDLDRGITLNFGHITGGGPVNVVPDFALCRLNVRTTQPDDYAYICTELKKIADRLEGEGITFTIIPQHERSPKLFDKKNQHLFEAINLCAHEVGLNLECKPSGGACDGNLLSAYGLPVIDSLGVIGNHLHTSNECMEIDSLVSRTRLITLFLLKLAGRHLNLSF